MQTVLDRYGDYFKHLGIITDLIRLWRMVYYPYGGRIVQRRGFVSAHGEEYRVYVYDMIIDGVIVKREYGVDRIA